MNYLEWVDNEIDQLQRAIVRLTIAREVIVSANKALSPKNRVELGKKKQKVARGPRIERKTAAQVRGHIIVATDQNWLTPRQIVASVRQDIPDIRDKTVWSQLFLMRKSGMLIRNAEGEYCSTLKETIEALEKQDAA